MPDFWSSIWDALLWFLTIFIFLAYLMALFSIIVDLFRDHKLNGWAKAVWFILLILFTPITAIIYLIVRGRGMGQRSIEQAKQAQDAQEAYIRHVAGGPAAEIAEAKRLLDEGAISAAEFETLKSKALA